MGSSDGVSSVMATTHSVGPVVVDPAGPACAGAPWAGVGRGACADAQAARRTASAALPTSPSADRRLKHTMVLSLPPPAVDARAPSPGRWTIGARTHGKGALARA